MVLKHFCDIMPFNGLYIQIQFMQSEINFWYKLGKALFDFLLYKVF